MPFDRPSTATTPDVIERWSTGWGLLAAEVTPSSPLRLYPQHFNAPEAVTPHVDHWEEPISCIPVSGVEFPGPECTATGEIVRTR